MGDRSAGFGDSENLSNALRLGAFDFIHKPTAIPSQAF
jgi:FixJ family two-component response regulator